MPKSLTGPSTALPMGGKQISKGQITQTIGTPPKTGSIRGFDKGGKK